MVCQYFGLFQEPNLGIINYLSYFPSLYFITFCSNLYYPFLLSVCVCVYFSQCFKKVVLVIHISSFFFNINFSTLKFLLYNLKIVWPFFHFLTTKILKTLTFQWWKYLGYSMPPWNTPEIVLMRWLRVRP